MSEPNTPETPFGTAFEVLTPGEKFGNYQILRCFSYDLLGNLYQVRQMFGSEERTVFVLPLLINRDRSFERRFLGQAQDLCKLEHPNIYRFHSAEVVKKNYAFFCDAYEGETLMDYVGRAREAVQEENHGELLSDHAEGIPAEEAKPILRQVLQALDYAHNRGVCHLNLNPTNILRHEDGTVQVVGFGLMSMVGKELFESLVSSGIPPILVGPRKVRLNTVDILSPEIRLGQPGDHRSDIYAFGMTAYWLLTGQKPSSEYRPPSELVPDLEPGWDTLIANCLEVEPAKRYTTAAAVLHDMDHLDSIQSLRSAPLSPGPAQTKSIFRHIDIIPVPRPVARRGIWTARAFRLCIIGLVGTLLAYLTTNFFQEAFLDNDETTVPIIRTPEGRTPRIAVNISPPVAGVHFPEYALKFLVRDGTLHLNALSGLYHMEVEAPLFKSQRIPIQLDREPLVIEVVLEQAMASVGFEGPPGTSIQAVDGEGRIYPLGQIPEEGRLQLTEALPPGTYDLEASLDGHQPHVLRGVNLSLASTETIPLQPTPIPGTLRVRSTPQGATILINGKVLGETNATIENLPVLEEFIVSLQLEGYRLAKKAVILQPEVRSILNFGELIPQSGELLLDFEFNGVSPSEAQLEDITLRIRSGEWETSPDLASLKREDRYYQVTNVPAGTIRFEARHPAYHPLEVDFELPDAGRYRIPIDFQPLPTTVQMKVTPESVRPTLQVNGQARAFPEDGKLALPHEGNFTLRLFAPGFEALSYQLEAAPGKQAEWTADLQAIPGPVSGEPYTIQIPEITLAWIPAGSFAMGSPVSEHARLPEEGPTTYVTLTKGFWMSAQEITQEQYQRLMERNPSRHRGAQRPVDSVTWTEAVAFTDKLTEQERQAGRLPDGYRYRLPTEAEWEYAARAGTETPFWWGGTADATQGNFRGIYPRDFGSTAIDSDQHYGTKDVGSFPPNPFGLYDIHGNVREWVLDYYNGRLPGGNQQDWLQRTPNPRRSFRGGGWEDFAIHARSAYRGEGRGEDTRSSSTGFRIVLAPEN